MDERLHIVDRLQVEGDIVVAVEHTDFESWMQLNTTITEGTVATEQSNMDERNPVASDVACKWLQSVLLNPELIVFSILCEKSNPTLWIRGMTESWQQCFGVSKVYMPFEFINEQSEGLETRDMKVGTVGMNSQEE
ncbi:hypothetical protein HMPREF1544_11448 [Mucor circinelloides 1006PhL]|uniref:Uncharacterized protein n=1 Tax=Mucor circinelloides f. circinelloides (strain 1006PhL) TaxID=1220926 RepID=S2J145_MUCC1|nr:hypothetical protein HMPREF1544_11448 [Mucor circinelloides 1006PhL]